MPRISVVLPVKNGEETIEAAVRSILLQTFEDYKVVVVDDGSTDRTATLVQKLCDQDKRVVLHGNPVAGPALARNFGIDQVDSEYIAVMDADDISLPKRLALQKERMDSDSSLVMVGGRIFWFGQRSGAPSMLISKRECREGLKLFSPVCHPTAFMRRKAFYACGRYATDHQWAEDFDLFCRLSYLGEIENIETPLLMYRLHGFQSSQSHKDHQILDMWATLTAHHKRMLGCASIGNARMLTRLFKTACALGPRHARQSLRALRNCFLAMSRT